MLWEVGVVGWDFYCLREVGSEKERCYKQTMTETNITIRFLIWQVGLATYCKSPKKVFAQLWNLTAFLDCKIRNIFFASWLSLLGSILLQNLPFFSLLIQTSMSCKNKDRATYLYKHESLWYQYAADVLECVKGIEDR